MEQLGLDRIALLHLHDPERIPFEEEWLPRPDGGDGRARSAGWSSTSESQGASQAASAVLDTGEFEVVLSHNRYTLLDRSAEPLFRFAAARV
jgi:D-threo-aldose 1-dehydrogenase